MTLKQQLTRIVKLAGTDPMFKGLVEALTEECPGKHYEPCYTHQRRINCADAGCSGRVLRSWEDQPQGALRGALYMAGYKANLWANESWDAPLKRIFLPLYDVEAVEVVLEALKGTTHATE